MIENTPGKLLFIRICIILLQYAPVIEVLAVLVLYSVPQTSHNRNPWLVILTEVFTTLLLLETTFAAFVYLPHKSRLARDAQYPPPLTRRERETLFARCIANVPDWDRYISTWFLGADPSEIKRDNLRDFILWGFFDRDSDYSDPAVATKGEDEASSVTGHEEELESYIRQTEALLGRTLAPGRGSAVPLRLTIDPIYVRYHSVVWYAIMGLIDVATHTILLFRGFVYFRPRTTILETFTVTFPPTGALRALSGAIPFPGARLHQSPSSSIGYWFRPHRSRTRLPVVFIHGIGIGLWPYTEFFSEINRPSSPGAEDDDEEVGILALEILPISNRLTAPPLSRPHFLRDLSAILAAHGPDWARFVLVSHSYGSVLTTHILRSPELGPRVRAAVLVDPVSVLLHLPDVAYNFTRRPPRTANEWQLWYFASMDAGVAEGLGRHFFWRENIIWREELVPLDGGGGGDAGSVEGRRRQLKGAISGEDRGEEEPAARRKVAVCLAGRDLIVDTRTVARYLASEGDFSKVANKDRFDIKVPQNHLAPSGIEILWFPELDHAQVFEKREHWGRVVEVIRRYCLDDEDAPN